MICTEAPGKGPCKGDSGGPLAVQDQSGKYSLIGIDSMSIGCAQLPDVYMRVSSFIDWIEKNKRPVSKSVQKGKIGFLKGEYKIFYSLIINSKRRKCCGVCVYSNTTYLTLFCKAPPPNSAPTATGDGDGMMDYGDDYGDDQPIPMRPAGPVKQNQASPATINLIYMLAEKD